MIPFLQALMTEFKKVCSESYREINTKEVVVYPYVTYSTSSEDLDNQEGFYIDVDVFDDCGADTTNLETLAHNIKQHFRRNTILNSDVLLQFSCQGSRDVPTGSKTLKRRNITLYCKIDWRS